VYYLLLKVIMTPFFLSKNLFVDSNIFFKLDKKNNTLCFISSFGKVEFCMYDTSCFVIKEGQKLSFFYIFSEYEKRIKKRLILSKKKKLGSLIVFFKQLLFRLSQPNFCSITLIGMGYRSQVENGNNTLSLHLGFSHRIDLQRPNNVRFFVRKIQRHHEIFFYCSTLCESKNLGSTIIRFRPVSPYTGKGLVWTGAPILRKEGKGQFKR
jgi:hypothetical protein